MDIINSIIDFFSANIFLTIAGIFLLLVIGVFLVKSLIKTLLVLVVVAAIALIALGMTPQEAFEKGKEYFEGATALYDSTVGPLIEKELEGAVVEQFDDGTYVVKTKSVTIMGKKGDPKAEIHYGEEVLEVDVEQLQTLIGDSLAELDNLDLQQLDEQATAEPVS